MAIELILKRNDLQPYYFVQAKQFNEAGTIKSVIDLTGTSIVCSMKSGAGVLKIDRQPCVVTDSTSGKFEYRWKDDETDTVGKYFIEFEINPSSGGKYTLPSDKSAIVRINEDEDSS